MELSNELTKRMETGQNAVNPSCCISHRHYTHQVTEKQITLLTHAT